MTLSQSTNISGQVSELLREREKRTDKENGKEIVKFCHEYKIFSGSGKFFKVQREKLHFCEFAKFRQNNWNEFVF